MSTALADKLVAGFYEVAITRLAPHPRNIRHVLGDLTEMAASIRDKGVLEPLLVASEGALVVCGHRRLAAASLAGRETVPCVVSDISEHEAVELMLVENLQRNDLTVVEEAAAYQQLLDFGQTADEIAESVSVNADRIRRRVALLQLPNSARKLLESHQITLGAAEELLQLRGHNDEIERLIEHAGFEVELPEDRLTPLASFGWQIADAKRRVKEIEDRAAATAKIEKEGLKVVDMPDPYDKRVTVPRRLGSGYGELNTPAAAHKRLDCHAVAIASNGKLVAVCTKPKNHPQAAKTEATTTSPLRVDYQARQRRREAAAAERMKVLRRYCELHPSGSSEVSALAVMHRNGYGEVLDRNVCDILGINRDGDPMGTKSFTTWLVEGATAIGGSMPMPTTQRLAAARMAIDLAFLDSSFEDSDDNATPWLVFLRGLGYGPTEEELELLDADRVVEWAKQPADFFA